MKPNVLLITTDQQHWNSIGAFNNEIETPNLDRLVKEGTTFKRAYCPNPTCTPSRASILTGKYPSQHGAWSIGTKLSEEEPTLSQAFFDNGYKTALVGKAHFQPLRSSEQYKSLEAYPLLHDLDYWRSFNQPFYGFDHVELARNHTNEAHVGQHYAIWLEEKGCENWRDYFLAPTGKMNKDEKYKWKIPEKFHYNTWISERTNKLLEGYRKSEENFFLWASFFDPHPPYLVPEPWDEKYDPEELTTPLRKEGEHAANPPHFQLTQEENPDFSSYKETSFGNIGHHSYAAIDERTMKKNMAVYYGMISMLDKYVGKILDKLDELGLTDETIVVFTTDHGHLFGQHGIHDKGGFHYEDLLKIPMIVRYPGLIPAGKESHSLQSLVDLAPTLMRLAEINAPEMKMAGVDQSNVWLGKQDTARDHILCEFRNQPTMVHQKTYVNKRYKLTVYYNQTYGELFDLEKDPNEFNNLWDQAEYQKLKKTLLLQFLWGQLGSEIMPMPRIAEA
ncbi:sulfatase family protein [Virgibacillus halodenitrificans]|uniref:Sulfatase-like hydrolase/transferase n=1 Tax=Virgibacillus halodenitrificans TaxID=1482 RepID=A0ABR7VI20_VIRHA|nr:sulfatase-like hydrolase/transferase [Virgibacillus halodenitrificans]MBD1221351.1 sulfatase-like hydrolase/transferase [Virgibacillus halodenitrificans]